MLTTYRFVTGLYAPDGSLIRAVKNLGWLLKHWKEVESFEMRDDYVLMARLRGRNIYAIKWADPTVARDWLSRPVFRGIPVRWFGEDTKAGEIKWRAEYERSGGKRRANPRGAGKRRGSDERVTVTISDAPTPRMNLLTWLDVNDIAYTVAPRSPIAGVITLLVARRYQKRAQRAAARFERAWLKLRAAQRAKGLPPSGKRRAARPETSQPSRLRALVNDINRLVK